jgi:uncharacterized membrane protein YjjP (DUF1212 family)
MEPSDTDHTDLVRLLVGLGSALVLAGEAVDQVDAILLRVAHQAGVDEVDVLVLPTVLMIQIGGETRGHARLASLATSKRLRLDQVSDVYELSGRAQRGEVDAEPALVELREIVDRPPPFGRIIRTLGLGVLSAGFAMALQPTVFGAVSAFVLGVLVGVVMLAKSPELRPILPVLVSFGVASIVFVVAEHYRAENPIRNLIPPLVIFLPGAAITTGTMELAARQTVAGSSRLVGGLVDLLLLAFGIVAAAAMVGTPRQELLDEPLSRLGPWTIPVSLVLIAAGNYLHHCAKRRAVPWILLVLVAASIGQTAGAALFTAELSAFFGALVMTPLVLLIGRRRHGPPAMVLFLPAFWFLVPGAAGLMDVTAIVSGGAKLSPGDFSSTMVSVVAIALGVLIGTAAIRVADEVRARAVSAATAAGLFGGR